MKKKYRILVDITLVETKTYQIEFDSDTNDEDINKDIAYDLLDEDYLVDSDLDVVHEHIITHPEEDDYIEPKN